MTITIAIIRTFNELKFHSTSLQTISHTNIGLCMSKSEVMLNIKFNFDLLSVQIATGIRRLDASVGKVSRFKACFR